MSTCCSKLCQVLSMLLLMQLSGIMCIFIHFLPYRKSLWNASRIALPVNQCIESFPELCNSFYRNLSNIFWEQCQATANCIQPLSWDACTMVNSKGKKHHFACRNVLCETLWSENPKTLRSLRISEDNWCSNVATGPFCKAQASRLKHACIIPSNWTAGHLVEVNTCHDSYVMNDFPKWYEDWSAGPSALPWRLWMPPIKLSYAKFSLCTRFKAGPKWHMTTTAETRCFPRKAK